VRLRDCYAFPVCIICVEFEKGRMTAKEARRALGEMVPKVGAQHAERALREAEEKAAASPRSPLIRLGLVAHHAPTFHSESGRRRESSSAA
jgi:hypothetical protein